MAEGILTLELPKLWGKYPPLLTNTAWDQYKEIRQFPNGCILFLQNTANEKLNTLVHGTELRPSLRVFARRGFNSFFDSRELV